MEPGSPQPSPRRGRFSGWAWAIAPTIFLTLAIAAYFTCDAQLVDQIHRYGIDKWAKKYIWLRKQTMLRVGPIFWPGHFLCTLLIATLLAFFHRTRLRGACLLLLAGIFTASNAIIKWSVGRPRPDHKTGTPSFSFDPFKGGIKGLFTQENLSFPSGDVALAVATAAALCYLIPRWRAAWWALAGIVALQRLAENAHHLSDVLAAAALGLIAFHCARVLCRLSPDRSIEP